MASETTVRSNTEIVREPVFNEHDPGLSSEYFAPEVKWHGGLLGTVEGSESVTQMLGGFIGALPDLHATEQDIVGAGETVAVRYVVEATHEGNLLGIAPTGRRVRWDAFDIYRLTDGMIVEEWAGDDLAAILYQVGAYTPPWLSEPKQQRPQVVPDRSYDRTDLSKGKERSKMAGTSTSFGARGSSSDRLEPGSHGQSNEGGPSRSTLPWFQETRCRRPSLRSSRRVRAAG